MPEVLMCGYVEQICAENATKLALGVIRPLAMCWNQGVQPHEALWHD